MDTRLPNAVEQENAARQFADYMVDTALRATFGEASSTLTVSFKKTVLIRDYETEVVEASSTITLDSSITGAERTFIAAVIRTQLEYEAYCNLVMKGMITQTQLFERKKCLANELHALKQKAEAITGKSMDKYLTVQ